LQISTSLTEPAALSRSDSKAPARKAGKPETERSFIMSQKRFLTPTALMAFLLPAGLATAQFGPGQQGPLANRESGYESSYSAPAAPTYQSFYFAPAAPMTYQSFYPGSQGNRNVLIHMRVPENAQVWFDGRPTTRQGTERDFMSPPLSGARDYTYRVRVQWMEGGRPVTEVRDVTVHAGDRIDLNFGRSTTSYYYAPPEPTRGIEVSEPTYSAPSWPSSDRTANPYYPR
jgi:uncharacterized protein (TIGR03000 family)